MLRLRYALVIGAALIVALAVFVFMSSGGSHPNRDYAPFAECPLSNPATDICIFAQAENGELVMGKKTIPITRVMILQGGVHENEAAGKQEFVGARDGNTLSRARQIVPSGLLEIIAPDRLPEAVRERFYQYVSRGITKVTATIELAAPASSIEVSTQNLVEAKGVGLSLPVKVKLSHPLLGGSCYIGSNKHPIVMPLTTGTASHSSLRGSIAGKPGHATFKDNYNLVTIKEDSLLSTSFAAPRAEGCGGSLSSTIDPAVNAGLGLPAVARHNGTILNGTLRDAVAAAVKASRR
jgi:hypothetical protein